MQLLVQVFYVSVFLLYYLIIFFFFEFTFPKIWYKFYVFLKILLIFSLIFLFKQLPESFVFSSPEHDIKRPCPWPLSLMTQWRFAGKKLLLCHDSCKWMKNWPRTRSIIKENTALVVVAHQNDILLLWHVILIQDNGIWCNKINFLKTQKTKYVIQTIKDIFKICFDCIFTIYY